MMRLSLKVSYNSSQSVHVTGWISSSQIAQAILEGQPKNDNVTKLIGER